MATAKRISKIFRNILKFRFAAVHSCSSCSVVAFGAFTTEQEEQERSTKKIYRNNLLSNLPAKSDDFLVCGMVGINIQGCAVRINGDQSGVERPLKMQNITADVERS